MPDPEPHTQVVTHLTVADYFRDSVESAIHRQRVAAHSETVQYLVNLLVKFSRSERVFVQTTDGVMMQTLTSLYVDALESGHSTRRSENLQRLGDLALFISGMFAESLSRKLVDVDYYIAMGGNAYGYLSERLTSRTGEAMARTFAELAEKFTFFVDVLNEVGEYAHSASSANVLRLYEQWLRTGSVRAAEKLRALGIEPATASVSRKFN